MSYCLEQLDIEQHKLIIQNMLSDQPLVFLSAARQLLDNIVDDDTATVISSAISDTTAGAGVSEEGMWHVDEKRVRRVMRDHCSARGVMSQSHKCSQYEVGANSLSDWEEKLTALPTSGRAVEDGLNSDVLCRGNV